MPATREDIADAVLHGKSRFALSVICPRMLSVKQTSRRPQNLEHLLHELSNSMHSPVK